MPRVDGSLFPVAYVEAQVEVVAEAAPCGACCGSVVLLCVFPAARLHFPCLGGEGVEVLNLVAEPEDEVF